MHVLTYDDGDCQAPWSKPVAMQLPTFVALLLPRWQVVSIIIIIYDHHHFDAHHHFYDYDYAVCAFLNCSIFFKMNK